MKTEVEKSQGIAGFISWFFPGMVLAKFDKSKQRHYLVHFNGDERAETSIKAKSITLTAGLTGKY